MNRKSVKTYKWLLSLILAVSLFICACGGASGSGQTAAESSKAKTESAAGSSITEAASAAASEQETIAASAGAAEKKEAEVVSAETSAVSQAETSAVSQAETSAVSQAETSAASKTETSAASQAETVQETASPETKGSNADLSEAPKIEGLTAESVLPLSYATCFNLFYYSDGYKVIDVPQSAKYLVVPEGKKVPEGAKKEFVILQEPFKSIYLAATSAMALFDAIDAIDVITMSGTTEGGWYIDAPNKALASGAMVYAGKYSEPDYETMIAKNCDLAIESTMILHNPEVKEMIEDIGIPVFIDRSAYEMGPLGRTEWVKLYGALLDKDDEANAFFAKQQEMIKSLDDFKNTGLTVAYFSINTKGSVVVRTNNDYIPAMINLAGGKYAFDGMFKDTNGSTAAISIEQFYSVAHDVDFLVYNATIENPLENVEALIGKNEVFKDFKAVKEGNIWQVDKTAYQSTDKLASLIMDFNRMLTGENLKEMVFLKKLD